MVISSTEEENYEIRFCNMGLFGYLEILIQVFEYLEIDFGYLTVDIRVFCEYFEWVFGYFAILILMWACEWPLAVFERFQLV